MIKGLSYSSKVLAATVLFTIVTAIIGIISGGEADISSLGWLLLSNLLVVSVLSYAIVSSRWAGFQLMFAIFLFYFGVSHFNVLTEAIFFQLEIPRKEATRMAINGFFAAVVLSFLVVWILGKTQRSVAAPAPRYQRSGFMQWLW